MNFKSTPDLSKLKLVAICLYASDRNKHQRIHIYKNKYLAAQDYLLLSHIQVHTKKKDNINEDDETFS